MTRRNSSSSGCATYAELYVATSTAWMTLRPAGRHMASCSRFSVIVQHLTRLEWRWIDGAFGGAEVSRSDEEFRPGAELSLDAALVACRRLNFASRQVAGRWSERSPREW